MPINDFRCKKKECKNKFEYFSVRSDDKPHCPKCGSSDLDKLPPKNTGFVLKGKGWARDKYGQ